MKVSVVIPLFNQERFIQRCITSIRNQTYTDIEIIVVDDGSTDNSKGIIEHNSISDRRIILIQQKNKGTLQARKTGIQESTGEAIITVDSDDYLKVDAISLLVTKMTETNADIVVADHCIHKNGRVINRKNLNHTTRKMLFGFSYLVKFPFMSGDAYTSASCYKA